MLMHRGVSCTDGATLGSLGVCMRICAVFRDAVKLGKHG